MGNIRWEITEQLGPKQAIKSLRELLHDQWLLPNRYIHYLRRRHNVLVNDCYQYVNEPIHPGDQVKLRFVGDELRTPDANDYVPTPHPQLQVLFENRDVIVVNKPRGQKSHPNYHGETGTLMNDVAGYLNDSTYMVHRLDQETSGAMLVAKNPVVVPVLNRLISSGQIHRQYLAVVAGQMDKEGELAWSIGSDPTDKRKYMVGGQNAKAARTLFHVIATNHQYSLVRLRLMTGRTHQIRVHLAHAGHPIIGDPLYNAQPAPAMLLHGAIQELVLPFTFQRKEIQAPLPPYFHNFLVKYDLVR
jgi:23S rRNA pseudouridine1911/1915/1917 synthase